MIQLTGVELIKCGMLRFTYLTPRCQEREWEWRMGRSAWDTEEKWHWILWLSIWPTEETVTLREVIVFFLKQIWFCLSSAAFWNSTEDSMPELSWFLCAQALLAPQQWGWVSGTLNTGYCWQQKEKLTQSLGRNPIGQTVIHRAWCFLGKSFITDLYPQAFFFSF